MNHERLIARRMNVSMYKGSGSGQTLNNNRIATESGAPYE